MFLSRGGRLTLIQSILSLIPTYYLSLFKAPCSVIDVIEKLMHDFFGRGGDLSEGEHLVAWKVVWWFKKQGRLGIGNVVVRNKALLMKWLRRFLIESQSL